MSTHRPIVARWIITAEMKLITAALIGQLESEVADATFSRTEGGGAFISGQTIAGALKGAACDWIAGYRSDEPEIVLRTFGSLEHGESSVVTFDTWSNSKHTVIRDHVRIARNTGIALDGHKFDCELLLPGVVFPFRIELKIRTQEEEDEVLGTVLSSLTTLASGDVSLGMGKTRGLGVVIGSQYRARRLDMTKMEGWLEYAELPYDLRPLSAADVHYDHPIDAVNAELGHHGIKQVALPSDKRQRLIMDLHLQQQGTFILRSPGELPSDPDNVSYIEHGMPVLTGATFIGPLRLQSERILDCLGRNDDDIASYLNDLFGSKGPDEDPEYSIREELNASRTKVVPYPFENAATFDHTRTKINPFTSGIVDGGLFTERPVALGGSQIEVTVQNPKDSDLALFVHLLRDIGDHLVTFGGEQGVGRGCFSPMCEIVGQNVGPANWKVQVNGTLINPINDSHLASSLKALVGGVMEEP